MQQNCNTVKQQNCSHTILVAAQAQSRVREHFEQLAGQLKAEFVRLNPRSDVRVFTGAPEQSNARYWRSQLVRTAREVDFYANLTEGSWWVRLRLDVLAQRLDYVMAVVKVGPGETGVLALVPFADLRGSKGFEDEATSPTSAFRVKSTDSVTLLPSTSLSDVWEEIEQLTDRTLSSALKAFTENLG